MKPSKLPLLLFRTPQFSIHQDIKEVWEELKIAIEYSSPAFFETIKNIQTAELDTLDNRTFYSIWKYFNRARLRPIPYGSFANFGTLNLSQTRNSPDLIINSQQQLHAFINWPEKENIRWDPQQLFTDGTLLCSNSSWYSTSTGIRFLTKTWEAFEIAEVQKDDFLIDILDKCREPVSSNFLTQRILNEYDLPLDELAVLLNDLIDLQLLYTNFRPNIIGEDYFNRIGYHPGKNKTDYLIAERKVIQGEFPQEQLNNLESCIIYLSGITQKIENAGLQKFKNDFQNRFDQRLVPLVVALDPELGCGYQELAQSADQDELIEGIKKNGLNGDSAPPAVQWTPFQKYLLQEIVQAAADKNTTVFLKDFPLEDKKNVVPLANTFSALFSVVDGNLILNHLGGTTANSLTGRFNLASEEVEILGKNLSAIESEANPEVIFFDVAYLSEEKVDNINRRKSVYDYELSIESWSCSKHPIPMNDIMVAVRQGEIILYSPQYGKRLVPRLSTAYNYTRSDLSLYRFLCDLQHQNLQTQLMFDVQSLLPGLRFYPRIQYKNIILSPSKWKISNSNLNLKGKIVPEAILLLRQYLNDLGIPRFFTAGHGDQHLCFDQSADSDLQALQIYLNKTPDFYISETHLPTKAILKDEQEKPYMSQFVLSLFHRERLYQPFSLQNTAEEEPKIEADIPPGKDWLYLEIYCHTQRARSILSGPIQNLVQKYQQMLNCWFFIRYLNPAHHIRLRLQFKPASDQQACLADFIQSIETERLDGTISDLQIKTYHREIDRYGADLMEEVEKHFCVDSRYVLQAITLSIPPLQLYKHTINLIKAVYISLNLDLKQQLDWSDQVQESFAKEHILGGAYFKKLNQHYTLFKDTPLLADNSGEYLDLQSSFPSVISACPEQRRLSMCTSLFHMHVNRLFDSNQRTHELIIYYFLYKELQSSKRMT